jgi:hypothetical protein
MGTNSAEHTSRVYFGWQEEKVNFLFGLSGRRTAMVIAAALTAVMPIAASNLDDGIVAWPAAALLTALAFVRIMGRTSDEWASAFASYQLLRWRNQHKFVAGPFSPHLARAAQDQRPQLDLPGVLAPIQILEGDASSGRPIAVAHHRIDRTYTAVAKVRFPGIGLVDSSRQNQRVAAWGALVSALCREGSPFIRIQTLQRIVPESGAELRRWHTEHLDADAPQLATEVTRSLLGTATLATSQRQTYLSFTLDERRASSSIKSAGGGAAGAAAVLARHLRALTSQIQSADLQVDGWLSPRDLAEVIRTAYDPHSCRHLAERRAAAGGFEPRTGLPAGVDPQMAGPAAAISEPGCYKHDGALSVTYWVNAWPSNQIYATSLAPLLAESGHRRSFSIHIEPLAPRTAARAVARERTARSVAVRMRERTGQIVPEHEKVALQRANAQDAERVAGHGLVRFSAFATVTVTDPNQLDDACATLEADASEANVEIRRMWMAQDTGFAVAALPLGGGLPRKRW